MKNINGITIIPAPKNADLVPQKSENNLTDSQRETAKEIADKLSRFFVWENTAEGHSFWLGVHDRLLAIGEGELLK